METLRGNAADHENACARVATQFSQRWLRNYVRGKLRRDRIYQAAYELLRSSLIWRIAWNQAVSSSSAIVPAMPDHAIGSPGWRRDLRRPFHGTSMRRFISRPGPASTGSSAPRNSNAKAVRSRERRHSIIIFSFSAESRAVAQASCPPLDGLAVASLWGA